MGLKMTMVLTMLVLFIAVGVSTERINRWLMLLMAAAVSVIILFTYSRF